MADFQSVEQSLAVITSKLDNHGDRLTRIEQRGEENSRVMGKIEYQATQTNGRMRALEAWRWFLAGGMAVMIFMMGIGVAIAGLVLAKT